jgi:hypothetical protein
VGVLEPCRVLQAVPDGAIDATVPTLVRRLEAETPLRCGAPLRPRNGADVTAQGHPRAIFNRAIERGNLLVAETTAREIGRVSLGESLALTALIAQKDPHRRSRVAARWLLRYLEANDRAGIEEAAMAAASLAALGGPAHDEAQTALRAMAERASRRPLTHGAQ